MKKGIFLAVFILLATSLLYFNHMEMSKCYVNDLMHIGEEGASEIVISHGSLTREKVYRFFSIVLDVYPGVLSVSELEEHEGEKVYVKYILYTIPDLMDELTLVEGRTLFPDEKESDYYLSTKEITDAMQVGQIASFSNQTDVEIRTLKSCELDRLFERTLHISLEDADALDEIIKLAEEQGIVIQKKYGASNLIEDFYNPFEVLSVALFVLLMLVILYSLLHDYKKLAIQKMLGNSELLIWMKNIMWIVVMEFVAMLAVCAIAYGFLYQSSACLLINYFGESWKDYLLIIGISVLFLSIPFLYLKKVRIIDMLKNKGPSKDIIRLNTLIKVILVLVFMWIASREYTQLNTLSTHYKQAYSYWENVKNYEVLGLNIKDIEKHNAYSDEEREKNKELYTIFNKEGAIYADFYEYLPNILQSYVSPDFVRTIKINPNYLEMYPIYDVQGERIYIDEGRTDRIILMPDKYRDLEEKISKRYENATIIWIQDEQAFFSFRSDVSPNTGNCIYDAIAQVLTENNGEIREYNFVAGYMGSPLKIKVSRPENAKSEIESVLANYYDLSEFAFPNHNVYETMETEIAEQKQEIYAQAVMLLLILAMIAMVIFYNIVIYHSENKVKLAIQSFLGYKIYDKIERYLLQVIASWIIIAPISIVMNSSIGFMCFCACFFIGEIMISFIVFLIVDRQNIVRVTKGG